MWELTFEAHEEGACALHRYFWSITVFSESWFDFKKRKWVKHSKGPASTHVKCSTLRAFKSHLRRHPELRGEDVILVNRYKGFNVTAKWVNDQ